MYPLHVKRERREREGKRERRERRKEREKERERERARRRERRKGGEREKERERERENMVARTFCLPLYSYHKLVKFEQNLKIRPSRDHKIRNLLTMLTILKKKKKFSK